MRVCIYGSSSISLDEIYYNEAYRLGELLAKHGHSVVFGGGREGLMGALARGAYSQGGKITGIVPRFFDEPGILYEHCTEMLYTETMNERKQKMEENSDACIVLPGGIGTYEEFFEALTMKQLGKSKKAIIMLNTNGYFNALQTLLTHTAETKFMSKNCFVLYSLVSTPEEAVDAVENYIPRTGNLKRLSDYGNTDI